MASIDRADELAPTDRISTLKTPMAQLSELIAGCSTGQIQGLSEQVLEKIIADRPGVLSKIDHELIVCEGSQNNPYLQTAAYKALVRAVEDRGIQLHINSCLRTPMQQYMLYRQYKRGICGIRIAAEPPKSNHNSGLAIDIRDAASWLPFLKKQNWRWLGKADPVHYDFKGGGENLGALQVQVFQELWNQFHPDNLIKVDGVWGPITAAKVRKAPSQGFGNLPTLRKGMLADDVAELQLLLRKALGLEPEELKVDRHFGSGTFGAVLRFQEEHGLVADGIVGPKTIAKLEAVTGEKFLLT